MTKKIIDIHVHTAGPGDVYKDDLYWHKRFKHGIGFQALKVLKGWTFKKVGDELMLNTLLKQAEKMKKVDYVGILAFDNVYEVDGAYRGPKQDNEDDIFTSLYVSNHFVSELSTSNPKLLLGLSAHPFRDDAVEELNKYHEKAVLCKWIPSSQMIDLSKENTSAQEKLVKFYEKLAEIKLPLLFHTGVESSIPAAKNSFERFNSPEYIRKALDMGVTVILAHCGCSYFDLLQDNVVDEVIEFFNEQKSPEKKWDLYADISALFSPFRNPKILERIFENISIDKLIYGSDFPNPAKGRKESIIRAFLRFRKANLLNRYYKISNRELKEYYPEEEYAEIFTNFHRLLDRLGRGHLIS